MIPPGVEDPWSLPEFREAYYLMRERWWTKSITVEEESEQKQKDQEARDDNGL